MFRFQDRHFSSRTDSENLRVLAPMEGDGFKWHAFFKQRQLDHVEIVTGRKTVELEHRGLLDLAGWMLKVNTA
ncbi:hypothetical protein D3C87_1896370 [compost metagenome]